MINKLKNIFITTCIIMVSLTATGQNTELLSNDQIHYIKDVSSLNILLNKFKGKVVYIDFWATWCAPCLNEFKHNKELDIFFKENNIVRLYIAIERKTQSTESEKKGVDKWKNTVEKHNLLGYNYYSELKTDFFWNISEQIMRGKLSLPRFAIVNEKGIIVEKKAKKPSDHEKLIKQLSKYIIGNNQ